MDLSKAVVFSPALTRPEKEAVSMLIEEVQSRTGIRWQNAHSWPADSIPVIAVGSAALLSSIPGGPPQKLVADRPVRGAAEGYRIRVETSRPAPAVFVVGNDSRGVLFGVGHLLRTMRMTKGTVKLRQDFDASTAPRYSIRGHQLGYRPKTNSKDPAFLESALMGFAYQSQGPVSWWDYGESLNELPLTMHYENLDPTAQYKVRAVYAGDSLATTIRLVADESPEVHPLIKK